MVSTRKKRQSNRSLLSQLDDFDQDMIIGNTASERQENVVVNEGNNDQDFTVGTSNNSSITNENVLNVKTLERCFKRRIDREMDNIVETVEDRIQSAILTGIDNIVGNNIVYCGYNSSSSLRSDPQLYPTVSTLAPRYARHRLPSSQPLAYIIARLRLACFTIIIFCYKFILVFLFLFRLHIA